MEDYDSLIRAVVAGDRAAWGRLVSALVPSIRRLAASHKRRRARHSPSAPDDVSEVATASLERLSRDRFHNLRRYLVQRDRLGERAQRFDSWLYGAVDFTIREHVRRRHGRGSKASVPPRAHAEPAGAGTPSETPPPPSAANDLEAAEIRSALTQHHGDLERAAQELDVSAEGLQLMMARLGLR